VSKESACRTQYVVLREPLRAPVAN